MKHTCNTRKHYATAKVSTFTVQKTSVSLTNGWKMPGNGLMKHQWNTNRCCTLFHWCFIENAHSVALKKHGVALRCTVLLNPEQRNKKCVAFRFIGVALCCTGKKKQSWCLRHPEFVQFTEKSKVPRRDSNSLPSAYERRALPTTPQRQVTLFRVSRWTTLRPFAFRIVAVALQNREGVGCARETIWNAKHTFCGVNNCFAELICTTWANQRASLLSYLW